MDQTSVVTHCWAPMGPSMSTLQAIVANNFRSRARTMDARTCGAIPHETQWTSLKTANQNASSLSRSRTSPPRRTKKWFQQRILPILKHLKRKDGRKLYKVRKEIYNSENFGTPQIRKRFYIVGMRTDVPCLRRFKMPVDSGLRRRSLASLLASARSAQQVEDWELTHTHRAEKLDCHQRST